MNFGKQLVNFRTVVSEVSSFVGNPVYDQLFRIKINVDFLDFLYRDNQKTMEDDIIALLQCI